MIEHLSGKVMSAFYMLKMAGVALCEMIDDNLYEWPTDEVTYAPIELGVTEAPVATEGELAA